MKQHRNCSQRVLAFSHAGFNWPVGMPARRAWIRSGSDRGIRVRLVADQVEASWTAVVLLLSLCVAPQPALAQDAQEKGGTRDTGSRPVQIAYHRDEAASGARTHSYAQMFENPTESASKFRTVDRARGLQAEQRGAKDDFAPNGGGAIPGGEYMVFDKFSSASMATKGTFGKPAPLNVHARGRGQADPQETKPDAGCRSHDHQCGSMRGTSHNADREDTDLGRT